MKITTLVPAYRPDYLADVFRGLASQTYKDFRVVISDDSHEQEISKMIRSGVFSEYTKSLEITLIKGPRDEEKNHNALLLYWSGLTPLAHVHHDDDYLFPNFYEKHVAAHLNEDILLSISGRFFAGSDGIPFAAPTIPEFLADALHRFKVVNSFELIRCLLVKTENCVGEVTNMVISSKAWKHNLVIPDTTHPYYGLTDVSLVIQCAKVGNIACTGERYGVYRIHKQQGTIAAKSDILWIIPRLCWVAYCLQAWKEGYLGEKDCIAALESALRFCDRELRGNDTWLQLVVQLKRSGASLNAFSDTFQDNWMSIKAGRIKHT